MSRFLKQLAQQAQQVFKFREQVGFDVKGNRYFKLIRDGKEQRTVLYKDDPPDVSSIPIEWSLWLQSQRKQPPTPEEIEEANKLRQEIIRRAKEIEDDDSKFRYQIPLNRIKEESQSIHQATLNSQQNSTKQIK